MLTLAGALESTKTSGIVLRVSCQCGQSHFYALGFPQMSPRARDALNGTALVFLPCDRSHVVETARAHVVVTVPPDMRARYPTATNPSQRGT
jgi:hypothetical protein